MSCLSPDTMASSGHQPSQLAESVTVFAAPARVSSMAGLTARPLQWSSSAVLPRMSVIPRLAPAATSSLAISRLPDLAAT